jgi:D-alanyl-lipoteichoic acid acyltransferase DltB (MBOAT superfamily)
MLFASFDFLLFFCVAFGGYWALAGRPAWRAVWVVAASYFFYTAASKPVEGPLPTPWYFVGLLVLSTLVDFFCALRMAAAQDRARHDPAALKPETSGETTDIRPRPGRVWLAVSVLANLGLLGYFKYTGFLFEVVSDAAALLGSDAGLSAFKVLLPVGISFYTFESISYAIDVYRGRIPAERSLIRYAFFIAFFPKLVAGPILRAGDFLPQLKHRPSLTREDVDFAIWRITKGLIKKVLLADFIAASFADMVFASPTEYSSLENLLALYAFTLQIYADFSGYSDIAIGAARLLGFRISENFNRPYQATDIADFWRRWHMTLSTWLRDYVYYPLGGSRVGAGRTYVNLWITMFLVGIWHGASWNFVIYAMIQASAMVFNRFCRQAEGSRLSQLPRLALVSVAVLLGTTVLGSVGLELQNPWLFGVVGGALALIIGLLPSVEEWPALRPVHVLLTVHFSVLSRVFFRADSLESARAMAGKLVGWDGLGVRDGLFRIEGLAAVLKDVPVLAWAQPVANWGILLLLIGGFAVHYTSSQAVESAAQRWIPRVPAVFMGMGFAVLMGMLSLLLAGPRANIYFNF